MATTAQSQPANVRIRTRGGKGKEPQNVSSNHQQAVRLKVVIRHLPSLLKASEFRDITSSCVSDDTTEYFFWVQGKIPEECVTHFPPWVLQRN
jgi:regulator of nonsense transcripts 3